MSSGGITEPFGPASFIPVNRIQNICCFFLDCKDDEAVVVVCH